MAIYAIETVSCADMEKMSAQDYKVRYYWHANGKTLEISVLQMEQYYLTIRDEL